MESRRPSFMGLQFDGDNFSHVDRETNKSG